MTIAQTLTVSGAAGITASNGAALDGSEPFSIPTDGLAFPDFDMRVSYSPDVDNIPGSTLLAFALGLGSMPLIIEVHGATVAELQANRRALEAAFKQAGETITLGIGGETETYDFFPTWPKWGPVTSAAVSRIAVATLAVPVNPMGA